MPAYSRINSNFDVFNSAGRTQPNVIWELIPKRVMAAARIVPNTNRLRAHPTDSIYFS